MTQAGSQQISIGELAAIVVRERRSVLRGALLFVAFSVVVALFRPTEYTARTTFVPQTGSDPSAGLRSIAGQFGLSLAPSGAAQSPEFYAELATAPAILSSIVRGDISDSGLAAKRDLGALFGVSEERPGLREEAIVKEVADRVSASVSRRTGVVAVAVRSPDRALSISILSEILNGINNFNLRTRQSQGAAERAFADGRVRDARDSLRRAEGDLQRFLATNRQVDQSPVLVLERDRLSREVSGRQQLVVMLTQALEEARLREVRDTPVITILEHPAASLLPDPRNRVLILLLGLVGAIPFGIGLALASIYVRGVAAGRNS